MPETELKLRSSRPHLKAAAALLHKLHGAHAEPLKKLKSIYYDTPDHRLRAKGLTLRVRHEDGHFIQTVKAAATIAGAALSRSEWEDKISKGEPDLRATKSGRIVRRACGSVALEPQFTTEIKRKIYSLTPRPGTVVEAAIDEGLVIARDVGRSLPIFEIELELKRGALGAIYETALALANTIPVQIESLSKSERGYQLVWAGSPMAVPDDASPLRRKQSLAEVIRNAARHHFGQFVKSMPGALAHDPDSIHYMRVSLRRVRSTLYGIRDKLPNGQYESINGKLKHLLRSFGPARDWEVLMQRIEGEQPSKGLARRNLVQAAGKQKTAALKKADSAIASRANVRLLLESMKWFEDIASAPEGEKLKKPVDDEAGGILDELFDRVRRRSRCFDKQSPEKRHRLRLACKNLRYNVELYAPLYDNEEVSRFLKKLKLAQDDLGYLNDVSTARGLVDSLSLAHRKKHSAEAMRAGLGDGVRNTEKRARKDVASLRRTTTFW